MKTTFSALLLCSCLLPLACVTEVTNQKGETVTNPEEADPNEDLPVDDKGNLICAVSRIIDPVTVEVNAKNPKVVHFVGVISPNGSGQSEVYEEAKAYLWRHVGNRQVVHVRLQEGSNLKNRELYGTLMLPEVSGPGKFVDITQAMLSLGLLKLSDVREFQNDAIAEAMQKREQEARVARIGIWKSGAGQ